MFEPQPFDREKHVYRCDEFSELLKDAVRFFHGTPVCTCPTEERFIGAANVPRVAKALCKLYHPVWNRFVFRGDNDAIAERWRELHVRRESTLRERVRNYLECA